MRCSRSLRQLQLAVAGVAGQTSVYYCSPFHVALTDTMSGPPWHRGSWRRLFAHCSLIL
jgi:hypothetical protein